MATTVGSHSVAAFVNPSNGDALDATVVKGNDNTLRTAYVNHDADTGIHVQSSVLASRPAAGTAGRKWMTTDGGVKLWYDTGSVWEEVAYMSNTGNSTITGTLTVSSDTSVGGDLTVTGAGVFNGNVTLGNATGDTITPTARLAADLDPSANNTVDLGSTSLRYKDGWFAGTVTADTVSGTTVTGTTLTGTLSTAAQTNVTSVGTLGNITMSGTGTANLQDGILLRPVIKDYGETRTTPSISSNVLTLNLENGNVFGVSLNANVTTLTISNPSASGTACSFTLALTADGTARTVTWPASVKWANNVAPTLTSTNGKVDIFTFVTWDAGTTWYAFVAGQNF